MGIHPLVKSLERSYSPCSSINYVFFPPGALFKSPLLLISCHRAVSPAVLLFFWCVLVDYICGCGWRSEVSCRYYSPGATHLVVVI